MLRAWGRAHVDQQLDQVLLEQRNEFIDSPCRVADGPDSHGSLKTPIDLELASNPNGISRRFRER
jgi:hypothetical protein